MKALLLTLLRFFITLDAAEDLTHKYTVFGRVLSGEDTLQRIATVDVDPDANYKPREPVLVSRCGELERAKKSRTPREAPPQSESNDRGRRRRSNSGDVEMENSPVPSRPHYHRRTSDNAVDEGIRGRPRQRSGSRSPSRPLSPPTEGESSERSSPAKKHKRKRSPSPSRHADGEGHYERRRRSLPNQYGDGRQEGRQEDEDRYKPSPRRDDYRHQARRRDGDSYRPSRDRHRRGDGRLGGGRLGGGGGYDDHDPPVKFKGRGVMKY
jgi:peptidyl-prolyl isomerase G (cyclophilin G)